MLWINARETVKNLIGKMCYPSWGSKEDIAELRNFFNVVIAKSFPDWLRQGCPIGGSPHYNGPADGQTRLMDRINYLLPSTNNLIDQFVTAREQQSSTERQYEALAALRKGVEAWLPTIF
jgi:hypothetical protein